MTAAALSGMETGEGDFDRLARVCAAFGLGDPHDVRYLPVGVINRNWRVGTAAGTYAVKELRDPIATGAVAQH